MTAPARPGRALLVVGDANPDLILRGDVVPRFGQAEQLLDAADLVLGGSAAIVACGAARLGVPTRLVAAVGADTYGRLAREMLAARGVDISDLRTAAEPTGLTVVLSGPADRAILTFTGAIGSLEAEHVPLDGVGHLHVASYFLQPRLAAGLPGLFARAHAAGVTTSLDTNWDPTGRWDGVRAALAHADVFLPNAAELAAVTGIADPAAAAATLVSTGTTVVLKAGAAGAGAWWPGGGGCAVPALPVDAVDTTGAGDSFDAGFLAGYLAGAPVERCLAMGVVAGSLSTTAVGGTLAQPDAAELDSALSRLPGAAGSPHPAGALA
ncbi:MAG TPA: PfkB family carbohydrate kinase [Micromonosporaceae bacterium]|nr:PfkB family carbohydrate kinase [Micromonosporaceae bacterium]